MTVTLAVPDTAEGLQEALLSKKTISTFLEEGTFPEFMTQYVKNFTKADKDIEAQIIEQTDRAIAAFAKEHLVELRKGNGKRATSADVRTQRQAATKYENFAPGKPLDGNFESFWDYLETTHPAADPRNERIGSLQKKLKNAMSSTDPGSGGFLIPEEFRATLMELALETAVVRPRANVIPMQSLRISMPIVDVTSNAASVYGGVVGYWTEEGAALVQTQPAFGRVSLEAKKLTAYTEVPNELREDSAISVDALIDTMFPRALSWFEDIAFMFGSGSGEPVGVFNQNNNALVVVSAQPGQDGVSAPSGASIVWENVVNMYSRMLPSSLNSAVWVISPATLPQLLTTALSVGTGGALVGMAAGGGTAAPQLMLLGRPVIVSEKVGNLGLSGDINFVDFGQYLIGDRMAMQSAISTEYKFGQDITAYRFIERVDGRPWLQSAVTPRNSGPTLSPYVSLAARP